MEESGYNTESESASWDIYFYTKFQIQSKTEPHKLGVNISKKQYKVIITA